MKTKLNIPKFFIEKDRKAFHGDMITTSIFSSLLLVLLVCSFVSSTFLQIFLFIAYWGGVVSLEVTFPWIFSNREQRFTDFCQKLSPESLEEIKQQHPEDYPICEKIYNDYIRQQEEERKKRDEEYLKTKAIDENRIEIKHKQDALVENVQRTNTPDNSNSFTKLHSTNSHSEEENKTVIKSFDDDKKELNPPGKARKDEADRNSPSPSRRLSKPQETERNSEQTVRIGQGYFRQELVKRYNSKCAITSADLGEILIASHIVPWNAASADAKLDIDNGLLLSPNYDALFDKHLISFDKSGNIMISRQLSEEDISSLGINKSAKINICGNMEYYLAKHRQVFQMKNHERAS